MDLRESVSEQQVIYLSLLHLFHNKENNRKKKVSLNAERAVFNHAGRRGEFEGEINRLLLP
jgi:hypothetical protein